MKRSRYAEGWIIEYPEGSAWRAVREDLKDIARLRRVPLGVVALEAITQYVARERPKYLPPAVKQNKK